MKHNKFKQHSSIKLQFSDYDWQALKYPKKSSIWLVRFIYVFSIYLYSNTQKSQETNKATVFNLCVIESRYTAPGSISMDGI